MDRKNHDSDLLIPVAIAAGLVTGNLEASAAIIGIVSQEAPELVADLVGFAYGRQLARMRRIGGKVIEVPYVPGELAQARAGIPCGEA